MQATEGKIGRVFVLSLNDNDELPGCIEDFARDHGIKTGYINFIGGIKTGKIVAGPQDANARPVKTLDVDISDTHETAAIGLIAPDTDNNPVLHIHGVLGRDKNVVTGCLRNGVKVWVTGEAILYEIAETSCVREFEEESGFNLLRIRDKKSELIKEMQKQSTTPEQAINIHDGNSHIIHLFNASVN